MVAKQVKKEVIGDGLPSLRPAVECKSDPGASLRDDEKDAADAKKHPLASWLDLHMPAIDTTSLPELRPSNRDDLQPSRQALASAIQSIESKRLPAFSWSQIAETVPNHSIVTPQEAAVTLCGWCNKPGHIVKNCAGPPGDDGTIAACAVHNARHTQSECRARELWDWDLSDEYHWLVVSRGNLPPLQYDVPWEDIARDYMQGVGDECNDALPFTAEFCRTIPKHKFAEYDYDNPSRTPLGWEERTSSVTAFLKWRASR